MSYYNDKEWKRKTRYIEFRLLHYYFYCIKHETDIQFSPINMFTLFLFSFSFSSATKKISKNKKNKNPRTRKRYKQLLLWKPKSILMKISFPILIQMKIPIYFSLCSTNTNYSANVKNNRYEYTLGRVRHALFI